MEDQNLLRPLKNAWLEKIKLAGDFKERQFGKHAKIAMTFFSGTNKDFWNERFSRGPDGYMGGKDATARMPAFRMVLNKASELVQLFGPSLYPQNPHRDVLPKERSPLEPTILGDPNDPFVQQQFMMLQQQEQLEMSQKRVTAGILQDCLNYTPSELGLRKEVRNWIDEGIVKGMSVLVHELYTPPGGTKKLIGSFMDTIDNWVWDADAERRDEAKWVAQKCCHPYWEVEREYGYEPGALKEYAQSESIEAQSELSTADDEKDQRNRGTTNDLLTYWKIYSKMGIGSRLSGFGKDKKGEPTDYASIEGLLEEAGDYCFLVVCESCPYPLNLPPELLGVQYEDTVDPATQTIVSAEEQALSGIAEAVQWPIPFWADDEWPCTPIVFREKPNCLYPDSLLKPGMGQLMFLNWAMSFLAEKVMTAGNTILACAKFKREEIVEAFSKTVCGYSVLTMEELGGADIDKLLSFKDPPSFHIDLYRVIDSVAQSFDKAVGLSEILYGMSDTQDRSATASQVKQTNATIRIDDMRRMVGETMERVARKEAMALRWLCTPEDILPLVGELRAQIAAQTLFTQDVEAVVREYDYQILASELSPRNKFAEQTNLNNFIAPMLPILAGFANMGQVGPLNSLILKWGEVFNFDTQGMVIMPPPPPPPMEGPPPEPPPN